MSVKALVLFVILLLLVGIVEIGNLLNPIVEVQNHVKRTLVRFQALCSRLNVTYWACGGTLIGAIRNGDMIRHDDDIDVSVYVGDIAILQQGCRNSRDTLKPLISKSTGIYRFGDKWTIDVFPVEQATHPNRDRWKLMGSSGVHWPNHWVPSDPSLKLVSFGKYRTESGEIVPMNLSVLTEAEEFCTRAYGNWRVPKLTHVHSVPGFKESWIYGTVLGGLLLLGIGLTTADVIQFRKAQHRNNNQTILMEIKTNV